MEKIKLFFKNLWSNTKSLSRKANELKQNNPRQFYLIVTKTVCNLILIISLLLPIFVLTVIFATANFYFFDIPIGWILLLAIVILTALYLIYAMNDIEQPSKKVYVASTIIGVVSFAIILLNWINASDEVDITSLRIGFGLILFFISLVSVILLTWKQDIIMNLVYKLFKISEVSEVEYVNEQSEQTAE